MDCYAEHERGSIVAIGYIPRISIPSDSEKGDKIWQNSEYFINIFCNNVLPTLSPREEYPSARVNITTLLSGGQDFYDQNSYIFGVTYNGVGYDPTAPNTIAAPEYIDIKGAGTFNNHYKNPAVCSGGPEPRLSATFPARVRLYIKLVKNVDRVNKNMVLPSRYIALEFKGMSGARTIGVDESSTFRTRELNNIHILNCFVNVALRPANGVVDFGKASSRTTKNTSVSETFSVVMAKDPGAACTEQFNILGSFLTTDILSDYSHLGMGNEPLLKIFHKNGTAMGPNRFSQFASFSSSNVPSVAAPSRAELSTNLVKIVVEGSSSKDTILKIIYN